MSYESTGVEFDLMFEAEFLASPYGFMRLGEAIPPVSFDWLIGATKSTPLSLSIGSFPVEKVNGSPGLNEGRLLPNYELSGPFKSSVP